MVVYELLLAMAVNTLFFIDGSRFSVVQVGPPCTSPHCSSGGSPLHRPPLCASASVALLLHVDVSQQATPLYLPLCSLCCMILGTLASRPTHWHDVCGFDQVVTNVGRIGQHTGSFKCMSQMGLDVVAAPVGCSCCTLLADRH